MGEGTAFADFLPPLWVLRGANMQSTSDQQFTKVNSFTNYVVDRIVAVAKTGGFSVTCLGGIYTQPTKSGNVLVTALQSWAGLIAPGNIVSATLGTIVGTNQQSDPNLFLSLTTGNLVALSCDIFVFGWVTD